MRVRTDIFCCSIIYTIVPNKLLNATHSKYYYLFATGTQEMVTSTFVENCQKVTKILVTVFPSTTPWDLSFLKNWGTQSYDKRLQNELYWKESKSLTDNVNF
jgi:hypothetical protein